MQKHLLEKRLSGKSDVDERKKLTEKFYSVIGETEFYGDRSKGFCLTPKPYFLPYHVKPNTEQQTLVWLNVTGKSRDMVSVVIMLSSSVIQNKS